MKAIRWKVSKLSNCLAQIQCVSFKYLERCFQWSLWRAEGPSPLSRSPHGLWPAACNRSQTCSSSAVGCPDTWTGRSPWQPAEYTAPRTPPYCRETMKRGLFCCNMLFSFAVHICVSQEMCDLPVWGYNDGFARLSGSCDRVPKQPSGHGVHASGRLVQKDHGWPTDQSHACTQLPLIAATVQKNQ